MTNLIKRKKAERRFQLYGIFAVSLSLLFVLTLIVNIFSSGIGGFYKTSFLMEIHFDQKLLKLEDNPSSEQIEDASFRKLISYNFKENFSQYSKDEIKQIKKLFYRKIDKETQSYLLKNPQYLNQKVELLFTASTDIDQIHKGNFNRNIPEKQRSINNFQFEWKYDGIRIQLIKRSGNISLWTRGQELVNESFPELVEKMSYIKDDFVLDGELLVWNFKEEIPYDFYFLQKRINRKSPTISVQIKYPIIFIAYDLLEINGRDIREIILENRRIELEKYFSNWHNNTENNITDIFRICDLIYPKDWSDVLTFKEKSRENNTEGLIIKNKISPYISGRKKGIWWKYKVDPMQLDAVLIYAKAGSGRRAGLYTDYSFALWKDKDLIKFASAYSGLTNNEIKELDKWIRKNTIEKFGPVRSLKPEMVFEISFEKIQISKRHKSGIAVRFPRITKWRKDKKIIDADSLQNAYELMKKIS